MRISIKVKHGIPGFTPDQVVRVDADADGTPLDSTWRRRLKAGELDGSCEVVKTRRPTRKPRIPDAEPPAGGESSKE